MSSDTGADGYDAALGRTKPARGERVALVRYLEPDETIVLRERAEEVGEADGRQLAHGSVVILVTDRKLVVARTSGGFRPEWDVFTLPYGHLEPGVAVRGVAGTEVFIPTSGRRSYVVRGADSGSAARLAGGLAGALRAYRRDRMGLQDP